MNKEWTIQDCLDVALNDVAVASCEYLDCPSKENGAELIIAGRALKQIEKLAKKHEPKGLPCHSQN